MSKTRKNTIPKKIESSSPTFLRIFLFLNLCYNLPVTSKKLRRFFMYVSLDRDDEGVHFILLDDNKEIFYTSKAFETIDDCDKVINKMKENNTFIKWLP